MNIKFQVYRTLVRAGLKVCLETSETPIADIEKSAIYDSKDYRAAYLQVPQRLAQLLALNIVYAGD